MFPSGQTFLTMTLAGTFQQQFLNSPIALPTGTLSSISAGIIAFRYRSASRGSLIISAGVHGDETAPVEMLDHLVSDLLKGRLQPRKDCLFILGNPAALANNLRFIAQNLNRLFCPATEALGAQHMPLNNEQLRAKQIMQAVNQFTQQSAPAVHYDLHTTIRPSAFERFAILPYLPARACPHHQLTFLARSGIEALVNQNRATATFSAWTAAYCDAESFTLELGSVHRFGRNHPQTTKALDQELRMFLNSEAAAPELTPQPRHYPQQFTVIHEIINTGKGFKLNVDSDAVNFSQYQSGYEIWHDREESYCVDDGPVSIVFPNAQVGAGERAGLLVRNSPIVLL